MGQRSREVQYSPTQCRLVQKVLAALTHQYVALCHQVGGQLPGVMISVNFQRILLLCLYFGKYISCSKITNLLIPIHRTAPSANEMLSVQSRQLAVQVFNVVRCGSYHCGCI